MTIHHSGCDEMQGKTRHLGEESGMGVGLAMVGDGYAGFSRHIEPGADRLGK
jgi:hypothetical protein